MEEMAGFILYGIVAKSNQEVWQLKIPDFH